VIANLLLVSSFVFQAPTPKIAYTIAMPDPGSHLYEVTLAVRDVGSKPVNLQMPVWSPGRYARMDFAKNVQDFAVTGRDGRPVLWDRLDGSRWRITPGLNHSFTVSYGVFANAPMSGTFSHLDSAHANWNGASLFMYVEGRKQEPVSLDVTPPEGWTIMNGDVKSPAQPQFEVQNYDLLIDTHTAVAPPG